MNQTQPFVTVIIPVLNDAEALAVSLTALQQQTYPPDRFEVVVVDNGSIDDKKKITGQFSNVRLIYERKFLHSPYSARNRGLEVARGEIIAFLDATCEPVTDWLRAAVSTFDRTEADLIGGQVVFRFKKRKPSIGEYYDSISNLQMKRAIMNNNQAKTANLFVRRAVLFDIGFFPEGVRSGGDLRWTRRATTMGYNLLYCETAIVYKNARPLLPLLKKQWRVGKGKPALWADEARPFLFKEHLLRFFLPPRINSVKLLIERNPHAEQRPHFTIFWMVCHLIRVISSAGYLWGWLLLNTGKNHQG